MGKRKWRNIVFIAALMTLFIYSICYAGEDGRVRHPPGTSAVKASVTKPEQKNISRSKKHTQRNTAKGLSINAQEKASGGDNGVGEKSSGGDNGVGERSTGGDNGVGKTSNRSSGVGNQKNIRTQPDLRK